jgi:cell division protein FtsW
MIFLFLSIVSIVGGYNTILISTYETNGWTLIVRHTTFLILGSVVVLFLSNCPPKYFVIVTLSLPITWILLIITRFFSPEINSANRWLLVEGVSFQSSELAKLLLIISVAFLMSKYMRTEKEVFFKTIIILTVITCGCLLVDNFSTAFLLFSVVFLLLFMGISFNKIIKIIITVLLVGVIAIAVVFFIPNNHKSVFPRSEIWKARIAATFDKTHDTNVVIHANYQVTEAKNAIMRGGIWGNLTKDKNQRYLDIVPNATSDFIYVIVIEDFGLIGGVMIVLLYVMLFFRAGIIAYRCNNLFCKFLVIGCSLMLVMQALVHMMINVNILPVTGQPLPLVSQGGTAILVNCMYTGIILSVSSYENKPNTKEENASS